VTEEGPLVLTEAHDVTGDRLRLRARGLEALKDPDEDTLAVAEP
jgi:hypothetical protein